MNDIREEYSNKLLEKNPDLSMWKEWRQNKTLAMVPRIGHGKVSGKKIPSDGLFLVPTYKQKKGKWIKTGEIFMSRPHSPEAPVGEIVNCNCDIIYKAVKTA